ncbi:MAG: YdiU family protein [Caulobacteraceae bacterium]|nr:YdiU family protein [Caulobacter sp.]
MPFSPAYLPDPRFAELGPEFADAVEPAAFPRHELRLFDRRHAAAVGLDGLDDGEALDAFGRFAGLPGQPPPLAMRYHGHQFRSYNPDLGDGRGFLYAQARATDGRLLDLGTKGSGTTPWSRAGDGRLTLKGGVREALASAMLEALGVPTSRTLALVETGEALARGDEPSPTRSAVLTRLGWSHIRFGTFQRHAYFDRRDLLARLVDHVVELYYPDLLAFEGAARVAALLGGVVARSARLAAAWMAAGFVHGVLNTDNMNINGESFDYGPYRFLPHSDPGFTAAYFDQTGLYAFGRQAEAVFWNLQQLAGCLVPLLDDPAPLLEALNGFAATYREAFTQALVARLGVQARGAADAALAQAVLRLLAEGAPEMRWEPLFFDWFGGEASEARALNGPRAGAYAGEAGLAFRAALRGYSSVASARLDDPLFAAAEPEELLYEEIERLWAAIAGEDDWAPFHAKLARIEAARRAYGLAGTGRVG